MSRFPVTKTLKLDFLGTEWTQAFISFSGLSFKEMQEFADAGAELDKDNPESKKNLDFTVNLLKQHFANGKAWNGQDLEDITADDLTDLPVDALVKAVKLLSGVDQNL